MTYDTLHSVSDRNSYLLQTFGCLEWESELYRGMMSARCYPFQRYPNHRNVIPRISMRYAVFAIAGCCHCAHCLHMSLEALWRSQPTPSSVLYPKASSYNPSPTPAPSASALHVPIWAGRCSQRVGQEGQQCHRGEHMVVGVWAGQTFPGGPFSGCY